MEASDEDEEYSQFRLKKDQDQANEGSEEENSNPDEDGEEGEEGEEEGDEVNCYWFITCSWHQKNETTISPIHEFKVLQNVF